MRRRRLLAGLIALVTFAWASTPAASLPDSETVEYRVKAAFLFKFAKFVEWPVPEESSMTFCVLGGGDFDDTLHQTVLGKSVKGLPVTVIKLHDAVGSNGCSVLFVANSETRRTREILRTLAGRSVLTVGDNPRFARNGGVITFIEENGRVQFEINVNAAERAGLKLSSKLLSLARIVNDTADGNR